MDDGRRRGTGGFRAASSFPWRGSTIAALLWPLPHALVVVSVVIAVTIAVGRFVSGSGVGSVSSDSRRRCCAAARRNASEIPPRPTMMMEVVVVFPPLPSWNRNRGARRRSSRRLRRQRLLTTVAERCHRAAAATMPPPRCRRQRATATAPQCLGDAAEADNDDGGCCHLPTAAIMESKSQRATTIVAVAFAAAPRP